ncbi:MAG: glycosyltransferase [Pleurocapsa minor GSE-CHR-MK-17-07R]|jgi:glycosyltransferase involved in cell wall biosynthesis|nr:glycosyltransferase [Pleurocapsa minor GSE-CHR-MK 17-07R]
MPATAIIATVLNEGDAIRALMESLAAQTMLPDEIVIVDGGSTDQTVAVMRSYAGRLPVRVMVQPGANISAGRNRAIHESGAEIIAITDAGVRLDPAWFERITRPLLADETLEVSAGFFEPDVSNAFEASLAATTLPLHDEIDPAGFLPSSRSVAVRKRAWQRVGGYPEWLDYCEDLIFDLRLKATSPPFAFVPDALAHFRPRRSVRAYYRQYYLYARGDGKADLWRKRHAARYLTYLVALPIGLWLTLAVHPGFLLALVAGGLVYVRQPLRRLPRVLSALERATGKRLSLAERLVAYARVPALRAVGDIAKMLGYPVGWLWRLRQRPPNWRV